MICHENATKLYVSPAFCDAICHGPGQIELYERYAVRENLTVYYVGDYRKDSIHGDFLILAAQDTATWFALTKEFGIPRVWVTPDSSQKSNKRYISSFQDRKDPTQYPPMITLPSGKQVVDTEQSCSMIVDIIHQRIFLIFAKDEKSFSTIRKLLKQL